MEDLTQPMKCLPSLVQGSALGVLIKKFYVPEILGFQRELVTILDV